MKTSIQLFIAFIFITAFKFSYANGECVIVIQGTRQQASEDFLRNSTDVLVQGMGNFPGPPNITVLRPKGEQSKLGNNPARSEQTYSNKAELLAAIEQALCSDKCKNVVIAFVGHGMGGEGIRDPPPDSLSGGMLIGNGTSNEDFLFAKEIAALIDKCQKSVKLIAAACYSESMIAGIKDKVRNKGLIGVGVSSSKWKEESFANGPSTAEMYYEFIKYFLEDYYIIINDPNVMEQLKKKAEELKKQNEAYNEKIKAENAAIQDSIKKCTAELEKLKKERDEVDSQIKETKKQIEDAKEAIDLLKKRAELEKQYAEAKGKEKSRIKKQLDDNAKKLKDLGVNKPTGGKLDKTLENIEKEIKALEVKIKDLEEQLKKLIDKWMELKNKVIDLEFKLEKLNNLKPLVPIPDHLPLMELVIHEAFKSAKVKTKSSHPQEPIAPNTGNIEVPSTPLTRIKIGDSHFRFYKAIDKKTGKCVVVGYRCNADGVPIGPIQSQDCNIDCSLVKFTYREGEQDKTVEAKKGTDGNYKFTVDGSEVAHSRFYSYNQHLILPGELLAELYYAVGFGTIEELHVSNAEVLSYQYRESNLEFLARSADSFFDVFIEFLPHDEMSIRINDAPLYLGSEARRFTLLNTDGTLPLGEAGLIFEHSGNIRGTLVSPQNDSPGILTGTLAEDGYRFNIAMPGNPLFSMYPVSWNPHLMGWQYAEQSGEVQADIQREREINSAELITLPDGSFAIAVRLQSTHLSESEIRNCSGIRVLNTSDSSRVVSFFDVFDPSDDILVPVDTTNNTSTGGIPILNYTLLPFCENTSFTVQTPPPYPPEFGSPYAVHGLILHEPPVTLKKEGIAAAPESAVFAAIHPNPFSQSARLNLTLSDASLVELKIYNASGQLVKINNSFIDSGFHQIEIKGNELGGPGIYYYTINTAGKFVSGKIVFSPH